MERKLYRSRKNRMFLGVCGGLAEYYHLDPVLVRVIAVIVTVVSSIFPGVIAYFVLALVIPLEGSRAGNPQETFKENISDLRNSSEHLGEQFRGSFSQKSQSPEAPFAGAAPLVPGAPESTGTPPIRPGDPPLARVPAQPETNTQFNAVPRSNRSLYVVAVALVAVGIFFIIVNAFGWLWRYLWPLTLIIAGVIIITLVFTRKQQS